MNKHHSITCDTRLLKMIASLDCAWRTGAAAQPVQHKSTLGRSAASPNASSSAHTAATAATAA